MYDRTFTEERSMSRLSKNLSNNAGQTETSEKRSHKFGLLIRRTVFLGMFVGCLTTSVGCFLPIYSARPERRVQQLLYTSEDLRSMVDEWERFWFLDSPSHMTPIRTHGGIM